MSFISQRYADLTGRKIGKFTIECLIGRDRAGAPVWRVTCQCGSHQALNHAKVAHLIETRTTQASLFCTNLACPLSRVTRCDETLADIRKRENEEVEQAAFARQQAEEESTKRRKEEAKTEVLRSEWRTYWRHQICTPIAEDKIATWQRWQQLSPQTRKTVMDQIATDATVFYEHL